MKHLIPSHQNRPTDDPIFALHKEATERLARGEDVVNATVGTLMDDAGKLALLGTAARLISEVPPGEWAAYAPIAGSADFHRAVIADTFRGLPELEGVAVAAATPGGSGALKLAIVNYLAPGDAMLTTSSFWSPYHTLCEESDRRLETFSMFDAAGHFDVGALDAALGALLTKQDRALVTINDPCHNPSGYSMSRAEWEAVVACLRAHAKKAPVTLMVDMAYAAYAPGDFRQGFDVLVPLLGEVGLVFAWSASKTFTHYGLRVGALIACEPDAKERVATSAALSYSCRGTWSNCNRGGLYAITKLLVDPVLAASCDEERAHYKDLLNRRVARFNELAKGKLRYPRYEGGFFVTVDDDDPKGRAARMRERGVFVVPFKSALRLALCAVPERDVARVVASLLD